MALRKEQQSLRKWSNQEWRTSDGSESKGKKRYLPDKAWDALSPGEKAATNRAKKEGDSKGDQFVSQPKNIAKKTRKYRLQEELFRADFAVEVDGQRAGVVDADNEDEAISKVIAKYNIDVENIRDLRRSSDMNNIKEQEDVQAAEQDTMKAMEKAEKAKNELQAARIDAQIQRAEETLEKVKANAEKRIADLETKKARIMGSEEPQSELAETVRLYRFGGKLTESVLNEKLTRPHKGESKKDFISRFMTDELAKKEFPENKQRVAVAYNQWDRGRVRLNEIELLEQLADEIDSEEDYDILNEEKMSNEEKKRLKELRKEGEIEYKYSPDKMATDQAYDWSPRMLAGLFGGLLVTVLGLFVGRLHLVIPRTLKEFNEKKARKIVELLNNDQEVKGIASRIKAELQKPKKDIKTLKLLKKEFRTTISEKLRAKARELKAQGKEAKAAEVPTMATAMAESEQRINEGFFLVSYKKDGSLIKSQVEADDKDAAEAKAMEKFGISKEDIIKTYEMTRIPVAESQSVLSKYGVEGYNKPKRTPSHPTKSHLVVAKKGDQIKVVRFGAQGAKGSPKKEGESPEWRKRRQNWIKRHKAQNPTGFKDKFSALYWANKVKW